MQDNVVPYEAERALLLTSEQTSRKSMEDRKRRRDTKTAAPPSTTRRTSPSSIPGSPSHSRSPSPESLRHRRASDAALAILHGAQRSHVSGMTSGPSRRGTRSGSRTPDYRSSPYSCSSRSAMSVNTSCSSSVTSSPQSSTATTPASTGPNTPHDSNSPVAGAHGKVHPHHSHHLQHSNEVMHVSSW